MTLTDHVARPTSVPTDPTRRTSLVAGTFYLITFISIPTLGLYHDALTDRGFIAGAGSTGPILLGCVLEVIVALAGIGTAVTLFPVVRRQNEGVALGFVGTRVLEAAMIFTGVMSLLALLTLRQEHAGASADGLATTGEALVAMYKWAFLLGQTFMPALNALLLGSLLYRSRLVPRAIPTLGLIGAPLLLASGIAIMLGVIDRSSPWTAVAAPIALWEFSLGVWLVVKGFTPCRITAEIAAAHSRGEELTLS